MEDTNWEDVEENVSNSSRNTDPEYSDKQLDRIMEDFIGKNNQNTEKHQFFDQYGIDNQMMERQHSLLNKPFFKNLHFDATKGSDIRNFIFKLETLAMKAGIDVQYVDSLILDYISGDALLLVWKLMRDNSKVTWEEIKGALISWFDGRNTDLIIRRQLHERRQNETEPSRKYILDMMGINSRLRIPYPEEELIGIIKENLHQAFRLALLTANITSIDQLKNLCEECEHIWETGFDYRLLGSNLTTTTKVWKSSMKEQAFDAAVQSKISKQRKHVICWNCSKQGHQFSRCNEPRKRMFCYGCGRIDISKLECGKCNKKNK